jgi:hypothetical protein
MNVVTLAIFLVLKWVISDSRVLFWILVAEICGYFNLKLKFSSNGCGSLTGK